MIECYNYLIENFFKLLCNINIYEPVFGNSNTINDDNKSISDDKSDTSYDDIEDCIK